MSVTLRRVDATGVPQTCPIIDEVKDAIKNALWNLRQIERISDDPNLTNHVDGIRVSLDGLSDELEKIREHNSNLRDFGIEKAEALETLATKIIETVEDYK